VTIENYAAGYADAKNADPDFQMYGRASKAGQTFHDQHKRIAAARRRADDDGRPVALRCPKPWGRPTPYSLSPAAGPGRGHQQIDVRMRIKGDPVHRGHAAVMPSSRRSGVRHAWPVLRWRRGRGLLLASEVSPLHPIGVFAYSRVIGLERHRRSLGDLLELAEGLSKAGDGPLICAHRRLSSQHRRLS
jgi:hypothetical protein